ncbi:MAG TPA: transporter substrate-binding domain-containing protein [Methylomirabilota bacterium]|jgi:polar amino acid transport system substrate-binding protein
MTGFLRVRARTVIALLAALAVVGLIAPDSRAGLLDDIKKKKEIVIATEAGYAPFEYVEGGKIVGYHADMLALVMKDLVDQGVKINQLDLPFASLLAGLQAKKYDMIATALFGTEERAKRFAFTVPTAFGTTGIVTRADNASITKPDDLDGKTVGAPQATKYLDQMKALSEAFKKKGGKGIKEIKEYASGFTEIYADIDNGRIDAAPNGMPNLAVLMQKQPGKYKLAGQVGDPTYFAWATRKEDTDLLEYLNTQMLKLKKAGRFAELQKKWFGFTMDLPDVPTLMK